MEDEASLHSLKHILNRMEGEIEHHCNGHKKTFFLFVILFYPLPSSAEIRFVKIFCPTSTWFNQTYSPLLNEYIQRAKTMQESDLCMCLMLILSF